MKLILMKMKEQECLDAYPSLHTELQKMNAYSMEPHVGSVVDIDAVLILKLMNEIFRRIRAAEYRESSGR